MGELRRRRIRAGIITLFVFVAIGVAIWILINPSLTGLGGTHKDWLVNVTREDLVELSQQIVLARYVDEAVYEIPAHSREYDVVQSRTNVYRRFEVVESFKGSFEPGDNIYVGWNTGYTRLDRGIERQQFIPRAVAPLSEGRVYGLFLTLGYPISRHPDDPETRIWETSQGFDAALVDDQGRFSFRTNQYYRNALKDMGLKPVPGSGAPFELTTDDVERLVASGSDSSN